VAWAAVIVVSTPTRTVIVTAPTGTAVMAVKPVRVSTPARVPEVAWAPLRERPGRRLSYARRTQADEPQTCRNDECRYCNACNVFHVQFVSAQLSNLRSVGTADTSSQHQGDAKSVVTMLAATAPERPWICLRHQRDSATAWVPVEPINAGHATGRGSYSRQTRDCARCRALRVTGHGS
jgi:hypothetical protein